MAHNLENMFYVKSEGVPWHGLGTAVENALTTAEALKQSGLDWRVKKVPIQAAFTHQSNDRQLLATSDEFHAVVRNTDLKILGVVKSDYQEFQNQECFDFMDEVLGDFGKVRWHTAGSLKGGKHVWMLAQLTDLEYEVLNGDVVKNYVLLATSHDGSAAVTAGHCETRVVCSNTRAVALAEMKRDGGYIKIRHKGDIHSKVGEAQRVLGLMTEQVAKVKEMNQWLASQAVNKNYVDDFVNAMFPLKGENHTRMKNVQETVRWLIDFGKGTNISGVRGTKWGLLNALTEYGNHHKTYRDMSKSGGSSSEENRLWSLWYAEGRNMANEALAYLTEKDKVNA
jgi:phage/plasmid-like protein (TIGR03299 family)